MKAITITQPWATLVAIGAKTIETRDWETHFRGPIAIHAAKGFPPEARALVTTKPFVDVLGTMELPTAQIIAVATLSHCFQFSARAERWVRERSARELLPTFEADFGDFAAGRYGFILEDVCRLEKPIYARGQLGLWNLPTLAERELAEQLKAVA